MSPRYFRLLGGAVLGAGMAFVLFFSYKASGGRRVFNAFVAWALVPYLVSLIATAFPQGLTGALGVLLGCGFLVVGSAWAYYDAFFVHTDAQNGLVFVFFPIWQLAVSVVLIVCAGVFSLRFVHRNTARSA